MAAGVSRTNLSSVGRKIGISRASSIMVRSISSTAIGSRCTMCWAASIASRKLPKWHGADRAAAEQRRQFQFDAGGKAERALRADQHMRQIDVVLAGHQRVEIVAADAALHLGKARGDLVGFARADGEQILGERAQRRRHVVDVAADAAEMRQRAVGQHRLDRHARCRAWCRSASSGRRRNCCRPCRRWWRARRSRYRPETTGRAA